MLDWVQSFALAIGVNVLILGVLSLMAASSYVLKKRPPIVVSVSPSEKDTQTEASSSNSSAKKKEQRSREENLQPSVSEAYRSTALSRFSLPSVGNPTIGNEYSSGSAEFGIGQSVGRQGVELGVGPGEIGTIFEGKGLGDGSEMLLYVDKSRSMSRHSRQVSELVHSLFPRAKIVEVMGCAIVEDEGFVRALESNWSMRSKVFFVCDLRDEVTYGGLQKLRRILLQTKPSKELHIISFQHRPMMDLKSIVDETWGSVSLVMTEPPRG